MKVYETDLLFGVVSGFNNRHFLLADIDHADKKDIISRVANICIGKHELGTCYIIRTGKGWHVVNFTDELSLKRYIDILDDLECDPKFIYWVKKVGYGVLRVSRRSSHWNVPYLDSVIVSPYKKKEHDVKKVTYFGLLDIEKNFKNVQRVSVVYDKKVSNERPSNRGLSSLRKEIIRSKHNRSDKRGKKESEKGMGKSVHSLHSKSRKGAS